MSAVIETLTIADAAQELKVSESMIRKMIKTQGLPHIKFGNRVIIERADLRLWVDSKKIGGAN